MQLELALNAELVLTVELELDNIASVKAMLQQQGRPVPPPMRIMALVDTGASVCAASPNVVRALRLPSQNVARQQIMTAGGPMQSQTYCAALHIPALPTLKADFVRLNQFNLSGTPFDFIIGMNVLMRWSWSYDRATQKLILDDRGLTT